MVLYRTVRVSIEAMLETTVKYKTDCVLIRTFVYRLKGGCVAVGKRVSLRARFCLQFVYDTSACLALM